MWSCQICWIISCHWATEERGNLSGVQESDRDFGEKNVFGWCSDSLRSKQIVQEGCHQHVCQSGEGSQNNDWNRSTRRFHSANDKQSNGEKLWLIVLYCYFSRNVALPCSNWSTGDSFQWVTRIWYRQLVQCRTISARTCCHLKTRLSFWTRQGRAVDQSWSDEKLKWKNFIAVISLRRSTLINSMMPNQLKPTMTTLTT